MFEQSVECSIQAEAIDVARSAPHGTNYPAELIYVGAKEIAYISYQQRIRSKSDVIFYKVHRLTPHTVTLGGHEGLLGQQQVIFSSQLVRQSDTSCNILDSQDSMRQRLL